MATRVGEIESMLAPKGEDPAGILIDPIRETELFVSNLERAMAQMLIPADRKKFAIAAKRLGATYIMERVAHNYVELYNKLLLRRRSYPALSD